MPLGGFRQDDLKLTGTHRLRVYSYDVFKKLDGSVHTIKKNTQALVVASKQTGLEVNANKTQNTVMSRDQNPGRSHHIKTDNSSFERVE